MLTQTAEIQAESARGHARPFNFPYNGRLDPATTALLVIDMQFDFLSNEGYFAKKGYDPAALRKIIPNISALVPAARDAGCKIIWTRQGYRADLADVSDYDRWRCERSGIDLDPQNPTALSRNSPGFPILPEMPHRDEDIVIDKTANGAFCQTDLELVLRAQGIRHLIFTGVTTDVCVHTTLREANDRKFECLTIEDACASGDAYAHAAAIHMVTVEDGVFGAVASTAALLDALTKGARDD